MFEQLIYVSRRLTDSADADLADILRASRRNNPEIDVTGVLMVTPTHYIQALEGPSESIWPLLDFIESDPRHGEMRVVARLSATRRSFATFAMAHADPDAARTAGIAARIDRLDGTADPDAARALLRDLARHAVSADHPA